MMTKEVRVLIAEPDNNLSSRMHDYLRESGFKTKVISSSYLLQKALVEWQPHYLFIDLLFPSFYAQQCLRFLQQRGLLGEDGVHVIVMSKHNAEHNVKACLESGADDFLVKPFQLIDLLHRLSLLAQTKKHNMTGIGEINELQVKNYFQMISLLVSAANQKKTVTDMRFEIIKMVSLALKAVRTSIIVTDKTRNNIQVIRSSDDPSLSLLNLDLKKYPEVQYVLRTEKPIFIESLEKDRKMSFVKHELKSIDFDCMMVLPIKTGNELMGCVSIRMPKEQKKLSFYDIKIAEIMAQLLAITWSFEEPQAGKKAS